MRDANVKHGRFIEASLMQGGAMLSVIRLIANYLERGTTQRTSMPNGVFNTADGQLNVTMVRPDRLGAVLRGDRASRNLLTDPRFADPKARGENLDELLCRCPPDLRVASRPPGWRSASPSAAS